jgi:hypothetical protein
MFFVSIIFLALSSGVIWILVVMAGRVATHLQGNEQAAAAFTAHVLVPALGEKQAKALQSAAEVSNVSRLPNGPEPLKRPTTDRRVIKNEGGEP